MAKSKDTAVGDKKVWADSEQTGPLGWREVQLGSETRASPQKALNARLVWMVMRASLPGPSHLVSFPGQHWPGACKVTGEAEVSHPPMMVADLPSEAFHDFMGWSLAQARCLLCHTSHLKPRKAHCR